MKSNEERLWAYLDGALDREEKVRLEEQLNRDETLKRELALRRKLHEGLGHMEPEQPSLRFTRNLMERLPRLYRRIQIRPLIGLLWVRTYLGLFILTLASLLGFGVLSSISDAISFNLNLESSGLPLELDAVLPLRLAVILMSVTAAVLFLLWLDKRMKKRFKV